MKTIIGIILTIAIVGFIVLFLQNNKNKDNFDYNFEPKVAPELEQIQP